MRLRIAGVGSILVALTAAAALSASLPDAWRNWKYFRPIDVDTQAQSRLATIEIPNDVYPHAQPELRDMRMIDDQGHEIPYMLRDTRAEELPETIATHEIERSFSPGNYSQFIFQTPAITPSHNEVEIDTAQSDFFAWVEIAVSDDGHDWRVIKDRAPIFRFRSENHEGSQVVDYPESSAHFIRVRILDASASFRSASVRVLRQEKVKEVYQAAGVNLQPENSARDSVWRATLPSEGFPFSQIRFQTSAPEFDRNVHVEVSNDGVDWTLLSPMTGEIYRFRRDARETEKLEITVNGNTSGRQLRVTIINGSNAPLDGIRAELMTSPRVVVFEPKLGRNYLLLYGQSEIGAPRYDLARTIDNRELAAAAQFHLGEAQLSANYDDPRPWTEKHPVILWIALVLAAVILGATAIGAMRNSSRAAS